MTDRTTSSTESLNTQSIPTAIVLPPKGLSWSKWWWLAALCAGLSLGLFFFAQQTQGIPIVIEFKEGHGIKPEDRLKHLGIDVGVVEQVELAPELTRVFVHVRLQPKASSIAREGSQFWIVRPSIGVDSVSGLETILGAKYLAVSPASPDKPRVTRFVGRDVAPVATAKNGSLEILLDGATKGGLSNGAPILYRGYQIGSVVQVGLATDARSVRARCAIDPEYRDLVRTNTKFWNRSGWRLNVGLTGVRLDADSIVQILSGGIEMATPDNSESSVNMGHRFVLHSEARPEWTDWKPSIGHGEAWGDIASRLPQPIRIGLRWQERSFGFRVNRQIVGWCLPLTDGTVLCLKDQIIAPETALAGSPLIEFAGISMKPESIELIEKGLPTSNDRIVRFRLPDTSASATTPWPIDLIKSAPTVPFAAIIVEDNTSSPLAIDMGRLSKTDNGWTVDSSIVLAKDLLGAPVIHAEKNVVVGLLLPGDKGSTIVPFD